MSEVVGGPSVVSRRRWIDEKETKQRASLRNKWHIFTVALLNRGWQLMFKLGFWFCFDLG